MIAINSTQLTTLNEKAVSLKFNSILNIQDANSTSGFLLKPDGQHVLKPMMFPHTNASGLVSCRCLVLMAIQGQENAERGLLDISVPDSRKLFGETKALIH